MQDSVLNLANPVNRAAPINRGLVGWWYHQPGAVVGNRWIDLTGRFPATLFGSPRIAGGAYSPGQTAMRFASASSQYANVPLSTAHTVGSKNLLVSAWINPAAVGSYQVILGRDDGAGFRDLAFGFGNTSGCLLYFTNRGFAGAVVIESTAIVTANTWQHVAVARNGTTVTFWHNGVEYAGGTDNRTADETSATAIGRRNFTGFHQYFDGKLQDVRYSLSASMRYSGKAVYEASRTGYQRELNWLDSSWLMGVPTGGGTDALTATAIATDAPSVGSPALSQVHALVATAISADAPSVGSPALVQVHALTATGISTDAPSAASPVIAQVQVLTATGIDTTAPSVASPTLSQVHGLTATGIDSSAPSIGSPTLAQVHTLTATGIAAGTPVVDSPAVGQIHALVATDIATGACSVDSPALTLTDVLTANGISSGSPSAGSPALSQAHSLTPTELSCGAPNVDSPVFGQLHVIVAQAIASGAPVLGAPVLISSSITTGMIDGVVFNGRLQAVVSSGRLQGVASYGRLQGASLGARING
jgi:hypothetical protein